ncbi:MAG: Tfx family DNA-binding protein [Haloquadratum sp.]|jgi:Tfx family DNA-binding protein|nr:Tfx family DNA-binding protein [Haloferacaceae archaeon]MDR9444674.1 Tfx family DNA-binding protein [Haloquadratum sp.]
MAADGEVPDPDELLARLGFDPEANVLTQRQAEVLVLREQGLRQTTIAEILGTSRANVSSVESSARENVAKAEATVAFAAAMAAPVQVQVERGTDLYEIPSMIFDACDAAEVKVSRTAPEVLQLVTDAANAAVDGRLVTDAFTVDVTPEGHLQVRL